MVMNLYIPLFIPTDINLQLLREIVGKLLAVYEFIAIARKQRAASGNYHF